MAKGIVHAGIDETVKDTEVIDRLVHDIANDLTVIKMEADLLFMGERFKRGPQYAFDAAQDIERLLREVRQYFLLRR